MQTAALRLARSWVSVRPEALGVLLLLLLSATVRLPFLAGGQLDYDEGVYWLSLRAMAAGQPLFSAVYSSQPPAFLLLLAPAHLLSGGSILADRTVVFLLWLAGVAAGARVAYLLHSPAAALLAGLLLSADPLCFRESVTLQADGPALGLVLVALALAVESRGRSRCAAWLLALAAGAVYSTGVLTKLLALPALPALAIVLAAAPLSRQTRILRLLVAGAGAVVAAAAFLLPFVDRWPSLWAQVIGLHLHARTSALGGLDLTTLLSEIPLLMAGLAGFLVARR